MNNLSHNTSTAENSLENDLHALSKMNDNLKINKIDIFRTN
jgi:hypothetical protein